MGHQLGYQNVVLTYSGHDLEREQAIFDRINDVLKTPEASSLVVRENNNRSNLLGLGLMILPATILIWRQLQKR